MIPVVVDSSWPAYIADRRCPSTWFRPENDDIIPVPVVPAMAATTDWLSVRA